MQGKGEQGGPDRGGARTVRGCVMRMACLALVLLGALPAAPGGVVAAVGLPQTNDAPAPDPNLTPLQQHQNLFDAARQAFDKKDLKRAHQLLVQSSAMDQAGAADWNYRFRAAYRLQDWPDAAQSLVTLLRGWPQQLDDFNDYAVNRVLREAKKQPPLRLELLNALFDADWKAEEGEEPSFPWSELALLLLQGGDSDRARQVAARVTSPYVLIGMRADRRYAALVSLEHSHYDIERALARELDSARDAIDQSPDSLKPVLRLVSMLLDAGQYQQVLQLLDDALARAEPKHGQGRPYQDQDEKLAWVMDCRSRALWGLGRRDEALAQMSRAAALKEKGVPNVSQSINLAFLDLHLQRPRDALAAIAAIDADSTSAYGRMQVEAVRFGAALERHDQAAMEKSLGFLAQHQQDAASTYLIMLVWLGRMEQAERQLVQRLADPEQRFDALMDVQQYLDTPAPPQMQQWRASWRTFLARPGVKAAIAEVGQSDRYELGSDLDW